jgi:YD repeat-containing protein
MHEATLDSDGNKLGSIRRAKFEEHPAHMRLRGEIRELEDPRNILARANSETFSYDTDGNLTSDAAWQYTYDAANRVKTVQTLNNLQTSFGTAAVKLKFSYDYFGRHVKKEVYKYTGSAWPTTPDSTYTYLYDGMTMIAEFTGATPVLSKSYHWGLAMSGSIQGAGGVGGFLGMKVHSGTFANKRYAAINDSGGNVVGMLDLENYQTPAAEYEYSPLGEPLRAFGTIAKENPWRFSTKYFDAETGCSILATRREAHAVAQAGKCLANSWPVFRFWAVVSSCIESCYRTRNALIMLRICTLVHLVTTGHNPAYSNFGSVGGHEFNGPVPSFDYRYGLGDGAIEPL